MRAHTWLFECALDAAFPVPLWIRIQVFDDGTMTATIEEPPHKPGVSGASERLVFGQPAGFEFYAMDGNATWRDIDGEQDARCRCYFKLMRFSTRLREGQLIECEAELLPSSHNDSALGSRLVMRAMPFRRCMRRTYAQDLELPASRSMRLIHQDVTPSISPLVWKLTPGRFVFQGFTCAVSEMLYECKLTLTLAIDGSVIGFSEDVIHTFTRKSKIQGYWSADCVTFQLLDESGDTPHIFVYCLSPHPSGLRGSWHEQSIQRRGYFQEGHAELTALSVKREGSWSPSLHSSYPVEFQEAARICVDMNATANSDRPKLPQDIWDSVLSNCSYDWF